MRKHSGIKGLNKTLLVIGAGSAQIKGIERAKEIGCRVIAIDGSPHAPGLAAADETIVVNFTDARALNVAIKNLTFDAVVAFACEAALPAIARIAHARGLPGLSPEQAALGRNKFAVRERCRKAGIATPFYKRANTSGDARKACEAAGFPCVIKPVDSAGSRGVTLISHAEEVVQAFERAAAASSLKSVLIEEFMYGMESSVEGFVLQDGVHILALSDKIRTLPPYLLDTEVIFPTQYSGKLFDEIKEMATRVVQCLELSPTPFHMEMMVTPKGPMLVEVGLRGPGFKVFSEMIPRVTGIDVIEASIRLAFGLPVRFPKPTSKGAVIKFFAGRKGVVRTIDGVESSRKVPGIEEVELYVKPGDKTRDLTSSSDRLGHVIAYANDRQTAIAAADKAFGKTRIGYERD